MLLMYIVRSTAAKRSSVNATNCLLNLVLINLQFLAPSVKRMHPAGLLYILIPWNFLIEITDIHLDATATAVMQFVTLFG